MSQNLSKQSRDSEAPEDNEPPENSQRQHDQHVSYAAMLRRGLEALPTFTTPQAARREHESVPVVTTGTQNEVSRSPRPSTPQFAVPDPDSHSPNDGSHLSPTTMAPQAQADATGGNIVFGGGYMTGLDIASGSENSPGWEANDSAVCSPPPPQQLDGAADSGEEADDETGSDERGRASDRLILGNRNVWIPEGVAGPSSLRSALQAAQGFQAAQAADGESESSQERQPSPLSHHPGLTIRHDTPLDSEVISESEYVRWEALRGGSSLRLLTPSPASDSDGLMMAPISQLRTRWGMADPMPRPNTRDLARGRAAHRILQPDQTLGAFLALRSQRSEQMRDERAAMERLRSYAGLGDVTAQQRVQAYDRRLTEWEHGYIRAVQQIDSTPSSIRLPHAFPPTFARRSLEFIEHHRREQDHILFDIDDDRAIVFPNSNSAPSPLAWEISQYLAARVPYDMEGLEAQDALDLLDNRTRASARSRWAWSLPPPYHREDIQSLPRPRSASPQENFELSRRAAENSSTENRHREDLPSEPAPIERPSPTLAASFMATQRDPTAAITLANARRTVQQQHRERDIRVAPLAQYAHHATRLGLPSDLGYLVQQANDRSIPNALVGAYLRDYLTNREARYNLEMRITRSDSSASMQGALALLQLPDAPSHDPSGTEPRTPTVQQNSTGSRQQPAREGSTSRAPAGQPPLPERERQSGIQRDSVSQEVPEEDKTVNGVSVKKGKEAV